jgi:hypothetical protein
MGRRKSAVLDLKWKPGSGGGWVDLRNRVIHFDDPDRPITNKRRGSARMPKRLVSHMRRWKRLGGTWVVEWEGERVRDIKTAFFAACKRAQEMHADWLKRSGRHDEPIDLSDVSPHVLKHTAISFYFQDGGEIMPATKYFATSARTLEFVYFNHNPEGQAHIAAMMNRPGRVESLDAAVDRGDVGPPLEKAVSRGGVGGSNVSSPRRCNVSGPLNAGNLRHSRKLRVSDRESLERLVWTFPRSALAELYGLSDRGLAKRCAKFGIAQPPRGFWQMVKAGRCPLAVLKSNNVLVPEWVDLSQLVAERGMPAP